MGESNKFQKYKKLDGQRFRVLLELRRKKLIESEKNLECRALDELSGSAEGEISSLRLHNADLATNQADQEMMLRLVEAEIIEIQNIERALQRLDLGTYGLCLECGVAIVESRLEVMPETEYCLSCQKQKEQDASIRRRPHEPDDPEVSHFDRLT